MKSVFLYDGQVLHLSGKFSVGIRYQSYMNEIRTEQISQESQSNFYQCFRSTSELFQIQYPINKNQKANQETYVG